MGNSGLLIGDIGGTHARFALAATDGKGYRAELTLNCADHETPEAAIMHYLEQVGAGAPAVICLAVAGPVIDQAVHFTNSSWQLASDSLAATFATSSVRLLNDFEAVALALPALNASYCDEIGDVPRANLTDQDFNVCVLGPGTGLGAAGLIRRGAVSTPVLTEAGHVGFAPEGPLQSELLAILQQEYSRVSDERLVSGGGIENIYRALGKATGEPVAPLRASEVFELARGHADSLAGNAVGLFFEILGQVAGNLVLAQGAFDGVYVAGGIAQRHSDLLLNSRFRRGFEHKGRHQHLMQTVPSLLIRHEQPGLLGAATLAGTL